MTDDTQGGVGNFWDDLKTFTKTTAGKAVFGSFGAIILAVATCSYTLGKDNGEKALSVYEASERFDFPAITKKANEAIDNLKKASAEFASQIAASKDYADIKKERDALKAENAEILKMKEKYDALFKEEEIADIQENTIHRFHDGLVTVGLPEISRSSDGKRMQSVILRVGTKSAYLSMGQVEDIYINFNLSCSVQLVGFVDPDSAKISVNCKAR